MKKLLVSTAISIAFLTGCKMVDVTREEFGPDGKTVIKRTSASVISFAMATELEYVHILGLGTAKAYKTDGGEAAMEALARGATKGAVEAGLNKVAP